jgi:molybdate transport system permease protein
MSAASDTSRDRAAPVTRALPSFAARAGAQPPRGLGLALASLPAVLFLILPLLTLLARVSPSGFLGSLAQREVRDAIWLSATTGVACVALTLIFGTPLAWLLGRGRFPGRRLLDAVIDLPIVLPPAVAGIALLVTLGPRGLLGPWLAHLGLTIAFTPLAVTLAQTFVAAPFYVRAAATAFAGIDRTLEEAAAVDGAGKLMTFWRVALPLCAQGLLAGALLTWARALGEFGATIIFAGNFPGTTRTMPLAIYIGFELDLGTALSLSAILLATSFAVLALVRLGLGARLPSAD